jgi:ankyrin repeat protein
MQNGHTPLHGASINGNLELVQFLVKRWGADVHAKDLQQRTALDYCTDDARMPIAVFLRQYLDPKPKMFALCMGLHCRLGVDSPLKMLYADVMQEIAKHMFHSLKYMQ